MLQGSNLFFPAHVQCCLKARDACPALILKQSLHISLCLKCVLQALFEAQCWTYIMGLQTRLEVGGLCLVHPLCWGSWQSVMSPTVAVLLLLKVPSDSTQVASIHQACRAVRFQHRRCTPCHVRETLYQKGSHQRPVSLAAHAASVLFADEEQQLVASAAAVADAAAAAAAAAGQVGSRCALGDHAVSGPPAGLWGGDRTALSGD